MAQEGLQTVSALCSWGGTYFLYSRVISLRCRGIFFPVFSSFGHGTVSDCMLAFVGVSEGLYCSEHCGCMYLKNVSLMLSSHCPKAASCTKRYCD